jgi:hypothetical protein
MTRIGEWREEQQALSYLKANGLELTIVINFGTPRVQSSRVVNNKGKAARLSHVPEPARKHD